MSQLCPTCNTQNRDDTLQCTRCGTGLASVKANNFFGSGYQQQVMPQQSQKANNFFGSSPHEAMPQQSQNLYPASQGYVNQQAVAQQSRNLYPQQSQSPVQMGTPTQGLDQWKFRRAFAGYGIPVMHHSWLLDGDHAQATALYAAIMGILRQRSFLGFNLTTAKIQERGYQTEERGYIIAQRGVSTVFIYVAPAGRDLYISRATSVLPAIDIFRVIMLCALVGTAIFGPSILTGLLTGSVSNPNTYNPSTYNPSTFALAGILSGIFTFLSLFIWGYLIIWVYRSFRYWLAEKDFLVYLRTRDLNDFQLDDIALLEHGTDETVLAAVKQLNLDASKIVPPKDYKPERHVKVV